MSQSDLIKALRERVAFGESECLAIVKGAEAIGAEYFSPKTDSTVWGSKECYEHGFYSGARWQRERLAPLLSSLIAVVEAAEREWHDDDCASMLWEDGVCGCLLKQINDLRAAVGMGER